MGDANAPASPPFFPLPGNCDFECSEFCASVQLVNTVDKRVARRPIVENKRIQKPPRVGLLARRGSWWTHVFKRDRLLKKKKFNNARLFSADAVPIITFLMNRPRNFFFFNLQGLLNFSVRAYKITRRT